jgi:hypothetical protein
MALNVDLGGSRASNWTFGAMVAPNRSLAAESAASSTLAAITG